MNSFVDLCIKLKDQELYVAIVLRVAFIENKSVPITTNVVSLNPSQVRCTRYNTM